MFFAARRRADCYFNLETYSSTNISRSSKHNMKHHITNEHHKKPKTNLLNLQAPLKQDQPPGDVAKLAVDAGQVHEGLLCLFVFNVCLIDMFTICV